jgi:hypothetical protein
MFLDILSNRAPPAVPDYFSSAPYPVTATSDVIGSEGGKGQIIVIMTAGKREWTKNGVYRYPDINGS